MRAPWLTLAVACAVAGCAARNVVLPKVDRGTPYRFETLSGEGPGGGDETFIILTLSGGGTRAAAFAYGVMNALYEQKLGDGRRLLDEVDVVSSVSGGSFAAAYLGLFGPRVFVDEFPDAVLYRDLEGGILWRLANPWNWARLLSPRFSRSDVATEYYDDVIFKKRTFESLPHTRPFVVLNATDIVEGAQFSFTQEYFDQLCSNLNPMPVARGVTASSAFPVAFPPITLTNYPKDQCDYHRPPWVDALLPDPDTNPPGNGLARTFASYERPERRYVHLSDGGLSDNIGLRAPYNALQLNRWGLTEAINEHRLQRLVVITVDAKPKGESCLDGSARPASWVSVLNAAATNPMENYSADTIELVRAWFKEWDAAARRYDRTRERCTTLARELCDRSPHRTTCRKKTCGACLEEFVATDAMPVPHPKLYRMHIRFDAIPNDDVRRELQNVDTRLKLSRKQVDLLVTWSARLLHDSPAYQDLVRDLGGEAEASSPSCSFADEHPDRGTKQP